jgi:hypothetical protein
MKMKKNILFKLRGGENNGGVVIAILFVIGIIIGVCVLFIDPMLIAKSDGVVITDNIKKVLKDKYNIDVSELEPISKCDKIIKKKKLEINGDIYFLVKKNTGKNLKVDNNNNKKKNRSLVKETDVMKYKEFKKDFQKCNEATFN